MARWLVRLTRSNQRYISVLPRLGVRPMRTMVLLIAGVVLAGMLSTPRASLGWTSAGLGIGYAGPYAYPWPYAPSYPAPAYYPPPPYYPPAYYPPAYYPPPPYYPPPYYGP